MHPAMRHVAPVRGELKVQTVMNMVGPLANPAGAGRQVVGVADARRLSLIAGALRRLDAVHAMVVHGNGMDEVSPFAETHVVEIRDGGLSEWTIDPSRFGLSAGAPEDLAGGSPGDNAAAVMRVLRGEANSASTAAVVLNAAAAFYVSGTVSDFGGGVDAAREAIKSGAGLVALDRLRAAFAKHPSVM
jgi:anthranilate phosphoribosyltransferase